MQAEAPGDVAGRVARDRRQVIASRFAVAAMAVYCLGWLSPNVLTAFYIPGIASKLKLVISAAILIAWLGVFRSCRKACVWSLPIFILLAADLFYTTTYHEPPTTNIIPSVVEATTEILRGHATESDDYLTGRWSQIAVVFGFALGAWALGVWGAGRLWNGRPATRLRRSGQLAIACMALSIVAVCWPRDAMPGSTRGWIDRIFETFVDRVPLKMKGIFPIGLAYSGAEYYRETRQIAEDARLYADKKIGAVERTTDAQREVYVLVIGETGRRDRMQLLGYDRPTTPRLSSRRGIIPIEDMVSPWTLTTHSVPAILKILPAGTNPRMPTYLNIVRAFKEAGYATYWISNQPSFGAAENPITRIARESEEWVFMNPSNNPGYGRGTYDGALLKPLKDRLARNQPRQFFIIHLLGSHDSYQRRHPPEFDLFRPSLTDLPEENPNHHDVRLKVEVNNSYDNSVAYTDFVLDQIISDVDGTGAVGALFYVADHGEDLFDGDCTESGHGGYNYEQYPVAAFVWLSDRYREHFAERASEAAGNAHARLTTNDVFPSMMGMAGIDFPQMRPSEDIFGPGFRPAARIVEANPPMDWDSATTTGACRRLVGTHAN